MPTNPIEIGRRAALAGALDALRSFRTLTELVRDSARQEGSAEDSFSAAREIAEADTIIHGISGLLGEVPGGTAQADLFASMVR